MNAETWKQTGKLKKKDSYIVGFPLTEQYNIFEIWIRDEEKTYVKTLF